MAMIDPAQVALFVPANLKRFKLDLFTRIGERIKAKGGRIVWHDPWMLRGLPAETIPIVGCQPEMTALIAEWRQQKRRWIYWDRGYARRVFATWLPRGEGGGYYRWHLGAFQLDRIPPAVSGARWRALNIPLAPWRRNGRHIVIAAPTRTYARFHQCESWIADTIDALARVTDRQLVIRDKETRRPLMADLEGAHALVTHGSIAAVESVIMGTPVFVDASSAAALVGRTGVRDIEAPVYPDREPWVHALACAQFNEAELVDGTLWRMLG
jgi:hypothetical protein